MAITLLFGKVSKRRNSTKVFLDTDFTLEVIALLKEGTSEMNPSFFLEITANAFDFNYCKWNNKYYFVKDITYERNELITVHCTMDVLATYKTDILNTSAFVLYDSVGNAEIIDKRLSTKTTCTSAYNDGVLNIFEVGYSIVLGIVGKLGTGMFALTGSEAQALMNELDTWQNNAMPVPQEPSWEPDPSDLSLILQNIGESIFNFADALRYYFRQLVATGKAPDCIKSAILIPVPPSDFSGVSFSNIKLGDYDTHCSGKLLTPTAKATASTTITVPWQASDWRKNSPYHNFYLSLPYLGVINIPASEFTDCNSINVGVDVSPNGGFVYTIKKAGTFDDIGRYTGNCSSSYLIGSSNVSQLTAASTLIGGAASAAAIAVNPGIGVAVGAATLSGSMGALQPIPSSIGGGGGNAFTSTGTVALWSTFHDTNVSPSSVGSVIGIPSMEVKSLANLTGFVQTLEASVSSAAQENELTAINNYLNGGIYIE